MYIAGDTDRFIPLQTGLMWLLTPVKSDAVARLLPAPHQYYVLLWDDHLLDLRVVVLNCLILVGLMIVVPLWGRRRGARGLIWSQLAATTGLFLGAAIAVIGMFAGGTGIISLAYSVGTSLLYAVSILIIVVSLWSLDKVGSRTS